MKKMHDYIKLSGAKNVTQPSEKKEIKKMGPIMNLKALILLSIQWALCAKIFAQGGEYFPLFAEENSISRLHTALKDRKVSCAQIVEGYIERIQKYNLSAVQKAPFNAITEINPNALQEALLQDKKNQERSAFPPLFCVPVLLKDNIDAYDLHSSSGSLALLGNQPRQDAVLVANLRQAGAIILGKSAMDELAGGIVGISGRNGRIGNSYDSTKNAGGSSGGSAVAVSLDFAVIGIGTDNDASIRTPAAFNGIVGLRPTPDLVSAQGILPRGNIDGVAGPMARRVEDLALVLEVLAQPASGVAKDLNRHPKPYSVYLNQNGLRNKKIGVVSSFADKDAFAQMPQESRTLFRETIKKLEQLGAVVIPNIQLPELNLHRNLNQAGEKQDINDYLASYPAVRQDYDDICTSGRVVFYPRMVDCLRFVKNLPRKYGQKYNEALLQLQKNRIYLEAEMAKNNLDALLLPVNSQGSATYLNESFANQVVASNAGLPAITFPIGFVQDMPVGLELISRAFHEGDLIEMAYAFEKNSGAPKRPQLPEENETLRDFDIPQYNHLITEIGFAAYTQVLKKNQPENFVQALSPQVFQEIVRDVIQKKRKQ